ncbi:MAG: hypothetical protein GPJ54_03245 [Candidatus Heimdallarchaeota archaeon]|nr:hypothetical protein [Candidatus Heimdallarchaeota archaeon]
MRIQHYLCRVKCNEHKGVICSWVGTLKFISNDQQVEESINYEKIKKIQDLDGYEKLGNLLIYLATPIMALIVLYYESVGLTELYVMSGFYFSIAIAFIGLYFSMRFGVIISHLDNNDKLISTKFTGYKKDIHLLMKTVLGELTKIVEKKGEEMVLNFV